MLQFQIMLSQLGTARQESSQVGVSHFCLSSSPYFSKKDHLCNVAISGLTVLYHISQSKKWKNTGMKGAQHKYTDNNLCIVNRWEVWKMLERWPMWDRSILPSRDKERVQRRIRGSCAPGIPLCRWGFHHCKSPLLQEKVFIGASGLWSNESRKKREGIKEHDEAYGMNGHRNCGEI